jgi:glucose/arabinose dehydrogenase
MRAWALVTSLVCCSVGCYRVLPGAGGGRVKANPERPINAADVSLEAGYSIEPVAAGLIFPTGVTWDDQNRMYVVESGYSYGEVFTSPRLLRVEPDGNLTTVATGENNGPWDGVVFSRGAFWVSEGGSMEGGRLLRISPDGKIERVVDKIPSGGDHHVDGPIAASDGTIYFSTGTMTNSSVVGDDDYRFGWLRRHPEWHDVPCKDVTLTGENFEIPDPRNEGDKSAKVTSGAFVQFGTATTKGQVIKGSVPCSGGLFRIAPGGGAPELVAWGFRNPWGLAFSPDGKLYVTDNGYDQRGARPIWGAADWLWRVDTASPGTWYGWPDYSEGRSVTETRYKGNYRQPTKILAEDPNPPQQPVALFACHSSSDGIDFSRSDKFGHVGEAFVAQFGDQAPVTGKVLGAVGFKVVRVDVSNGVIEEFAINAGKKNGPASMLKTGGLERPLSVRFSPDGSALYIIDFGVLMMNEKGATPLKGTGVLWRVTRSNGEG